MMLDNFTPSQVSEAAAELKKDSLAAGGAKKCLVEVSGGLTEDNAKDWFCPGACDFSLGICFTVLI